MTPPAATAAGSVAPDVDPDVASHVAPPAAPDALPPALAPWGNWLALFAPDLVQPLGDWLLRLQPLVGRLGMVTTRPDDAPQGVGDLVRRGLYERMLLSEWAIADAEPDEFIRRAAGGELLFMGPERKGPKQAARSVVLFDTGPSQLGEPRLAHIALWILLARRARDAGVHFEWGVLQVPGVLHTSTGKAGMRRLLESRTVGIPSAEQAAAWDAALGAGLSDCWVIGDGSIRLAPATAMASVIPSLAADTLRVALTQRRAAQPARQVDLPLPPSAQCVRLLRDPFKPVTKKAARTRKLPGTLSLKQPPRFAIGGNVLAVPMLEGGAMMFHSAKNKAGGGKVRQTQRSVGGETLAAAPFNKQFAMLSGNSQQLQFKGFPGKLFTHGRLDAARPPLDLFRVPPGRGSWLPLFFLRETSAAEHVEYVLTLDIDGRLACWTLRGKLKHMQSNGAPGLRNPEFTRLAYKVAGAAQFHNCLVYGCAEDGVTHVYQWCPPQFPQRVASMPCGGGTVLFGSGKDWLDDMPNALMAVQRDGLHWWAGVMAGPVTDDFIAVEKGVQVLGVARLSKTGPAGLVVLSQDRMRIEFRTPGRSDVLVKPDERIAQAAMDPADGTLAWISHRSMAITVRAIDGEQPSLHVIPEAADA